MTPSVLLLQGAAIVASLFHVLIDVWIDIFGEAEGGIVTGGPHMSVAQALTLLAFALLYGWWNSPIAAATAGVRGAMLALAILAGLWTFVGNGIAPLAYCPPPCPSAFPWHDGAHIASTVFGGWAALSAWRAYRAMPGPRQLAPAVTAVVLMLISYMTQAISFTPPPR